MVTACVFYSRLICPALAASAMNHGQSTLPKGVPSTGSGATHHCDSG